MMEQYSKGREKVEKSAVELDHAQISHVEVSTHVRHVNGNLPRAMSAVNHNEHTTLMTLANELLHRQDDTRDRHDVRERCKPDLVHVRVEHGNNLQRMQRITSLNISSNINIKKSEILLVRKRHTHQGGTRVQYMWTQTSKRQMLV